MKRGEEFTLGAWGVCGRRELKRGLGRVGEAAVPPTDPMRSSGMWTQPRQAAAFCLSAPHFLPIRRYISASAEVTVEIDEAEEREEERWGPSPLSEPTAGLRHFSPKRAMICRSTASWA